MTIVPLILLSLAVGILVGLLGIGGGAVLVPAMVYLLHYDQHMAQGTSLFILLPPIGLGALREYWKNGQVDLRAGIYCALGFLIGGYGGGKLAVPMPTNVLKLIFGCFLMVSGVLLWRKSSTANSTVLEKEGPHAGNPLWALGIFVMAGICGIAAGLVGIGGGVLLVPLLSLFFGFSQHRAQGTSLIALIPPTGLLAFLAYWKAGYVDLHTGVLLIPGVFVGGILGGMMARRLNPRRMGEVFAGLMFLLGVWQVFSAWRG
ncbi:MAG TPA: sulfite exporter TauE/SafE family protein [Candidatus Sulfotelmatobacter sp.]|jgi:uncharacterized membrane protein YfcA|nr:sulfite exporter TauE/SafE family protein [Candidatus Sulfotelmatobacter sp.]